MSPKIRKLLKSEEFRSALARYEIAKAANRRAQEVHKKMSLLAGEADMAQRRARDQEQTACSTLWSVMEGVLS